MKSQMMFNDPVGAAMEHAGFRNVGRGLYQRNGHLVRGGNGWLSVEPSHRNGDALPAGADLLGKPGLWRWAGDGVGRSDVGADELFSPGIPVFELPRRLVASLGSDDGESGESGDAGGDLLGEFLHWAEATSHGDVADGWSAPPADELKRLTEAEAMTVRGPGIACEIELHRQPNRLALRCPVVPAIPADLPDSRRQWLRLLVRHTQQTWHFVRVGIDEESRRVLAEVDLTGAPKELIPLLYPVTVDALRCVIGCVAKPAAVICDMKVTSSLLAAGPNVPA